MTGTVDGLPLYRRIEADLRDRIRTGELPPGARVETEQELMERRGVGRAAVRQALGGLIASGALEVRRGLGTYVAAARLSTPSVGSTRSAGRSSGPATGRGPGSLGLAIEPADETVAGALGIEPGAPVVALHRIRLADDEPIVVETSRLQADRFPGLETVDFSKVRLYDTLTTAYGCRPSRARETFEPILLSAAEAELLEQRRGEPALRVERVAFDQDNRPDRALPEHRPGRPLPLRRGAARAMSPELDKLQTWREASTSGDAIAAALASARDGAGEVTGLLASADRIVVTGAGSSYYLAQVAAAVARES